MINRYYYFISYVTQTGSFGFVEARFAQPITQFSSLVDIAKKLKKKTNTSGVTIINYQLLRSEFTLNLLESDAILE